MSKASSAIRQLRGGMMPFPESFLMFISTQSEDPPAGVFRSELMKARAIRDGRLQGSMLPVLYEFPESMQKDPLAWRNPENWAMVTPNLGRSIHLARLIEDFRTAEQSGMEELAAWSSQHLDVEIGLALHSDQWAGAAFWEGQAEVGVTLEEVILRSEVVTVGIDGGGLNDLLALSVVGRTRSGVWLSWTRAWAHPVVRDRNKQEAARFDDFADDGDLVYVDITEDISELAEIVGKVLDAGVLGGVGVDPVGIDSVVDALESRGVENEQIEAVPQGWKLAGAIKTTERRLADGTLRHAPSRLMDWSIGNAKVEPRGNAVAITKQTCGNAKIDPLMALFDAVYLMAKNPTAQRGTVSIAVI
jgi:phage terminase large subunit-like protein